MRTLLSILAATCVAILLVVLGVASLVRADVNRGLGETTKFVRDRDRALRESEAFYKATMPQVLFGPSREYLTQVWAPEERTHLGNDALDKLIARISTKPGVFQRCDGARVKMDSTFEASVGLFNHESKTELSATFVASCHFSEGSIEITTVLMKEGGVWGLAALDLSDPIPLPSKAL